MTPDYTRAIEALERVDGAIYSEFHPTNQWKDLDADCETIRTALRQAAEPWLPVAGVPEKFNGFVWYQYKDRSGPGYWAEGFYYKGEWQVNGFKPWDYEHKEVTHYRPIPAPPQGDGKKEGT